MFLDRPLLMPRWTTPLLVALAVAAVLAGWFWPVPESGPEPGVNRPLGSTEPPLLENWSPADLTLVFSGQQHGYLEPCGCSETQSGGFSRRADLLRQMDQRGFHPIAFDLGGLVQRRREQSRLKYQTMLAALGEMSYSAVGVGPEDLALGADFLLSQGQTEDPDSPGSSGGSTRPYLLAANLQLFDSDDPPTQELADPTRHAEIDVIRRACGIREVPRLPDCSIYVTVEPCPMCATAISFARLASLYYGASDPKGGGVEGGPRIFHQPTCHHVPELYPGVGENEAAEILRTFFQERR